MANFVDFLVDNFKGDTRTEGQQIIDDFKPITNPEDLLAYFIKRNYEGVSLEDCKKLLANKEHLLQKSTSLVRDDGY